MKIDNHLLYVSRDPYNAFHSKYIDLFELLAVVIYGFQSWTIHLNSLFLNYVQRQSWNDSINQSATMLMIY